VNLAITYGMGLIVGALVVAALYMWACARNARRYGEAAAAQPSDKGPQKRFTALRGEGRP